MFTQTILTQSRRILWPYFQTFPRYAMTPKRESKRQLFMSNYIQMFGLYKYICIYITNGSLTFLLDSRLWVMTFHGYFQKQGLWHFCVLNHPLRTVHVQCTHLIAYCETFLNRPTTYVNDIRQCTKHKYIYCIRIPRSRFTLYRPGATPQKLLVCQLCSQKSGGASQRLVKILQSLQCKHRD